MTSRRPRGRSSGRLDVVLLAGGSGTRFWPMSRRGRPKAFLALTGSESLLRATWRRARRLAPSDRVWVVAPRALAAAVRRELPELRGDRLVLEPSPRNTAPAIALACQAVARVEPGATVAMLPTDHLIRDHRAFARAIATAHRSAGRGALVCLGVRPDRPATGFGYIELAGSRRGPGAMPVRRFVEKPPLARARRFAASRRYLWNAGIVVGRVGTILDALRRHAPAVHRGATAGGAAAWGRSPATSFDRAVLEKAERLEVVPLDAGWIDVGSWDAAAALSGVAPIAIGSPGSAVFGDGRVIALVDVPGVVVVDTPDAVLVVARASAERVREVVAKVARRRPEVVR